jgi:hypothetical protein
MKKLIIAFFLFITAGAFAQSDKYAGAMGATLQEYGAAKDADANAAVAAKFERIGDAEKTLWLPYYYAALVKARMSMQGLGGDKDKVADEAEALLNKAEAIEKNSEIYCVKNMIATARMLVDPQSRYMQYMSVLQSTLADAKSADPANPRPYMLQAISLKNTPEQFGGGCGNAKPLAEKALTLYDSFKPVSPLHPNWGKEIVQGIVADCSK